MDSEAELVSAILRRCGSLSNVRLWRINTVGATSHSGRVIRSAPVGHPDIAGLLYPGRGVFFEVKSQTGLISKEQAAFGVMLKRFGAIYAVCRSVDDALRALEQPC